MMICIDCGKPAVHREYCKTHYQKRWRNGTLPPNEIKSYETMHNKIKEARGRAKDYPCVNCKGTASQWSLRHTTPAESLRKHAGGRNEGRVFSLDVEDYDPRCHRCHSEYDQTHNLLRAPMGNHTGKPPRPPCTIAGCESLNKARGMCGMHYKRWLKLRDK